VRARAIGFDDFYLIGAPLFVFDGNRATAYKPRLRTFSWFYRLSGLRSTILHYNDRKNINNSHILHVIIEFSRNNNFWALANRCKPFETIYTITKILHRVHIYIAVFFSNKLKTSYYYNILYVEMFWIEFLHSGSIALNNVCSISIFTHKSLSRINWENLETKMRCDPSEVVFHDGS